MPTKIVARSVCVCVCDLDLDLDLRRYPRSGAGQVVYLSRMRRTHNSKRQRRWHRRRTPSPHQTRCQIRYEVIEWSRAEYLQCSQLCIQCVCVFVSCTTFIRTRLHFQLEWSATNLASTPPAHALEQIGLECSPSAGAALMAAGRAACRSLSNVAQPNQPLDI